MSLKSCLEIKGIKAAHIKRNASVMELNGTVGKIKLLNTANPSLRQFKYLEKELEVNMDQLKSDNHVFMQHILHQSQSLSSDADFVDDQKSIRATQFAAMSAKDEYVELLENHNLIPKMTDQLANAASAANPEFTAILQEMARDRKIMTEIQRTHAESQKSLLVELNKNQEAANRAVTGPKPTQPFYHPKSDMSDYLTYKSFIKKFEYFTVNVNKQVDKLWWLLSSVKGDAYESIKNLSLEESNYEVALERLKKTYLDDDKIRQSIISVIYNYKNSSPDKDYSNVLKGLTSLENHLSELKGVHNIDCYEPAANLIISHIIFNNLPGSVKNELMNECKTLYPNLTQIFENIKKVVEKVNAISGNVSNSSKENFKKLKANSETQNLADNDRPFINVSNVNKSNGTPGAKYKNPKRFKDFSKRPCRFCKGMGHPSKFCPKFTTKESRWKVIKEQAKDKNLCETCTLWVHPNKDCVQYILCKCGKGKSHATVMCQDVIAKSDVGAQAITSMNQITIETIFSPATVDHDTGVYSTTSKIQRAVALQTAVFAAINSEAIEVPMHERNIAVLADTAAQRSLVTKELANKLKLPIIAQERASIIGYGQVKAESRLYKVTEITLGSPDGNIDKKPVKMNALVVNGLNPVYMTGACKFATRLQSKGLKLADRRLVNSKKDVVQTDLLVGADFYDHIISPNYMPKQVSGMWLGRTVFGHYVLKGKIPGSSEALKNDVNAMQITIQHVANLPVLPILENHEHVDDHNMFDIVKEINSYDALGIRLVNRDDEDKEAEKTFKSNMIFDKDCGKYVVGFPWLNNTPPDKNDLDSNYDIAKARFISTCKNLDKNPQKLEQYQKVHEQELLNDFIERVPENELKNDSFHKHFINHFPVWKDNPGATTKCRRVFDASLHKKGKSSLNDNMLKGSQMTPHILLTNLRLRLLEYLLSTDVSKAYMRMQLRPRDRNYTCFFARLNWKDPNSPIVIYRFKSVIFGATSSPFMLNCTVQDILEQNKFDKKLEIFVDNLFILLESNQEILPAAEQILKIFNAAAMPLHEFASNFSEANKVFKEKGLMTESKMLKTLGLYWDYSNDSWYINEPEFQIENITKRSILSDIARLYDIMGFLAPLTVQGRLYVQDCWENDFNWDECLTDEMNQKWFTLVTQLRAALQVPIPRWVGFKTLEAVSIHCFTDASDRALGMAIYLVSQEHSIFYTAKAKICPLKMAHFSIPRKELTALSLGARYLKFVMKAVTKYFHPASVHLWSDSMTCLTWCLAKKPHKQQYVRSRVGELDTKIKQFNIVVHYIKNLDNPADMLTKDTGRSIQDQLWTQGPRILLNPREWKPYVPDKKMIDTIPIFCGHVPIMAYRSLPDPKLYMPDIHKQDKLMDLHKDTVEKCFKSCESNLPLKLSLAQEKWIKSVQETHYLEVIQFLQQLGGENVKGKKGKQIIRKEKLQPPPICLDLFLKLDDKGIIRVETSHANCETLSFDQRFPILMPSKDPFTKLLIIHSHVESGHMGLHYTRSHLRATFWIPKVTGEINHIIKHCNICLVQRGQRYHVPASPALPTFRFNVNVPWNATALDMTGHMLTREHGSDEITKVYFIVFVCMATGIGHIEMTPDASSESFSRAFQRFTARRGVPKIVVSDQGSNFKGFNKELKEIAESSIIYNYLTESGIDWKWTPIGDPHFNGYVERSLSILKSIMKKSIGNKILSSDSLRTIACYAECLFNERPLCIMDASDPDFIPITPNMLNYGRSLRHFNHNAEEIDLNDPEFVINHKAINWRLKKLKSYLAQVRKIWIRDYLHLLTKKDVERQKRSPYTKSLLQPKINDWVLIKDGSNDLRIGRILELIQSEDGEIRSARVKTKSGGEGCYPITNLRYLEYHNEEIKETNLKQINDQCKQRSSRPQRKAALEAQKKFLINCLVNYCTDD